MRLVWHIVKKDFRRLGIPLGLWTLLLIAKGEVGVRALSSGGANTDRLLYFQEAEYMLVLLDAIVNVLLVATLVQEDTLVGTGAFWVTRPIGGGRLLAAKLLGAALMFGGLPLLVALRWWVACGYGAAEMGRAALALADVQVVTVFGAMVLAALTTNINQFFGWALGLGAIAVASGFSLALIAEATHVEITRGIRETRDVMLVVLVAVGGVLVIAVQFFTRRREWALLGVKVAAGLIVVGFAGAWDWSSRWARAPQTSALATEITLAVENVKLEPEGAMDFVLRGVPEDLDVKASADHVWQWSDGTKAAARSGWRLGSWPGAAEWRSLGLSAGNASEEMARAYVTSGPEGASQRDGWLVPMKFFLWPEKAERLQTERASYTGELHGVLLRPKLESELSLRAGDWRGGTSYRVRIDQVEWSEGELRLMLAESQPAWTTYGRHRPSIATMMENVTAPGTAFALVNRARGEAVKLWSGGRRAETLLVGTQELGWRPVRGSVPRTEEEKQSGERPAWLEGATLAVVRYQEEARFDREVKMEKFGGPTEGSVAK